MSDEGSGGDGGDLQLSDNGLFSEAAGLEDEVPVEEDEDEAEEEEGEEEHEDEDEDEDDDGEGEQEEASSLGNGESAAEEPWEASLREEGSGNLPMSMTSADLRESSNSSSADSEQDEADDTSPTDTSEAAPAPAPVIPTPIPSGGRKRGKPAAVAAAALALSAAAARKRKRAATTTANKAKAAAKAAAKPATTKAPATKRAGKKQTASAKQAKRKSASAAEEAAAAAAAASATVKRTPKIKLSRPKTPPSTPTPAPALAAQKRPASSTAAAEATGRGKRQKRATAAAAEAAGWVKQDTFTSSSEDEGPATTTVRPTKQNRPVTIHPGRGGRGRAKGRGRGRGKGQGGGRVAAAAVAADAEAAAVAAAAAEAAIEAAAWESDEDETENVADCIKPGCESEGVLVVCDNCVGAVHLECADPPMIQVPAEFYLCEKCRGMCSICLDENKRDTDIRCYQCFRLYHSMCLDSVPDPENFHWMCSTCIESDQLKVDAILHSRAHKPMDPAVRLKRVNAFRTKKGFPALKREELRNVESPYRGREYFVRWEGKAYWHCTWLVPYLLQRKSAMKLNNFIKKTHGALTAFPQSVDQVLLHEYKPRCTIPHRVLARATKCMDGVNELSVYLIKWRGLEYEEATWEMEGDLEDWMHLVEAFKQRQELGPVKEMLGNLHPPDGWDGKTPLPKPTRFEMLTEQPWGLSRGPMYPYQVEGLNFLRQSWWSNTNVILADEMGLGKTIQTIAFIRSVLLERPLGEHRPCLVICPLSTTDNWEREMEVWCPELNCVRFVGNVKSRTVALEHELFQDPDDNPGGKSWDGGPPGSGAARPRKSSKGKGKQKAGAAGKGGTVRAGIPKFHVMITHFEMLLQCPHVLKAIKWELLIVDEAHRLKAGATSKVAQLTDSLVTRHRLLLTGTPLQNTVDELFNLLQFIEPGKFSNKGLFMNQFTNLEREGQVAQLQSLLKPHMLRRMKKDVPDLDIPDKRELVVPVELSREQKEVYRAILTKNLDVLRKGDKNKGATKGLQNIVMQLKKACNHPYLCRPRDSATVEELVKASGKMQLLDSMLKKLHKSGNRVLVFSQMTALLDILQDYASYRGWRSRRIDGNTPAADRQRYIDDFNNSHRRKEEAGGDGGNDKENDEDEESGGNKDKADKDKDDNKDDADPTEAKKNIFLFFLSTKAGGQGINLATADTVIIYDSDWNPHNDLQALARAHRIGQANKVMIYRFVSRATVEERILEVAKKKLLLEHVVVQDGNRSMTQEQLNLVIKYGAEDLFREELEDEEEEQQAGDKPAAEPEKQTQAEKWGDGSHRGRKVSQWTDEAVDQLLDRSVLPEDIVGAATLDGRGGAGGGGDGGVAGAGGGVGNPNALSSLLQTFKVASFAQVEAPAEGADFEGNQEEQEGPSEMEDDSNDDRDNNDQSETGNDQDGSEGKSLMEIDGSTSAAETDGVGGDDAVLPGGPALFGDRPKDSGAAWEEILGKSYKKDQKRQQARLGRGKREKTQVKLYTADEIDPSIPDDDELDDEPDVLPDTEPDAEFEMPVEKKPTTKPPATSPDGTPVVKKTRHRQRDATVDVLASVEGVKSVVRCAARYGVPGGDWRPVMGGVVATSKLHLSPHLIENVGEAVPYLKGALRKALDPSYVWAPGKRRELLTRMAIMELIYRKLQECRGRQFDIQDKLCSVYIRQASGMHHWTKENDRILLIGCLKHGSGRFQPIIQDDSLGLRPALERALETEGGPSWLLVWGEEGPTGQPGFKGSPEHKFVKERLNLLEKALVDEHQYRTGKAAIESELKALLAKDQASLEAKDERIGILLERVKETQEREVPELVARLEAIEAFQAIGEEVTSVRHQQEDARKRLVDAFSAMSAYIQRYRCQQSEFDLGAALMNPMADCIAEVADKHGAVRSLHQENKDLDEKFDRTLKRYVSSVTEYLENNRQPLQPPYHANGALGSSGSQQGMGGSVDGRAEMSSNGRGGSQMGRDAVVIDLAGIESRGGVGGGAGGSQQHRFPSASEGVSSLSSRRHRQVGGYHPPVWADSHEEVSSSGDGRGGGMRGIGMVGVPSPVGLAGLQQALHHRRTGGGNNNTNIHASRNPSASFGTSNPPASAYTLPASSDSSFTPGQGGEGSRGGVGIGVGMGSLMVGGRGGGGSTGVTMGSSTRALQAQQQAFHQRHQAQELQVDQDLSQRQQQLHQHGRGTQRNEHSKLESPSSSPTTSSSRGMLFSPNSAGPGGPEVGGGGGAGPDDISASAAAAAAVVAAQQEESEGVQQVRHLLRVRQAMLGGVGAMPSAVGSSGPDLVGGIDLSGGDDGRTSPSAASMLLARVGRTSSFDQQQQQHLQNSDDNIAGTAVIDPAAAAAASVVTAVVATGAPPTLRGGAELPFSTEVTDNDNTSDVGLSGAE